MKIYFLCTGNSSRSQMAEAYAKKYAPSNWVIESAGTEPCGLNPNTVTVMNEVGINVSHYTSDNIDTDFLNSSDYVITLCGDANDKCPITSPSVNRLHWPLPDPALVNGNENDILTVFRDIRDQVDLLVKEFVDSKK